MYLRAADRPRRGGGLAAAGADRQRELARGLASELDRPAGRDGDPARRERLARRHGQRAAGQCRQLDLDRAVGMGAQRRAAVVVADDALVGPALQCVTVGAVLATVTATGAAWAS